ncbi:MAG: 2-iminoacetate synthase ThiH [Desulfobacterales bacterium]|jgi:2-iminoacetate synthase|nr:2-iminoacetate synthase ThiH [Desulfobacterales bacterium]
MSFYGRVLQFESFDFKGFFNSVSDTQVVQSLSKDKLTWQDFLTLLSPAALPHLEPMAQKARQLTIQYFGRTIQLYIPLYISNYCSNECVYCGFNRTNNIRRKKLTLDEIEAEAEAISRTEMRHILVLTGENREITPIDYIEAAIQIIKKRFSSVSIEMFPMDTDEYIRLKAAGVDGMTIYQEVYDRDIYKQVHLAGKKTDYQYRLDTPERGAKAGFRMINVGALFGLGEIRREAFMAGLHAKYLEDNFLNTEISLSLPRMNTAEGGFIPSHSVDDKTFVQFILAYRLFLPRAGITISTRESAAFRDRLMFLGVTRMSAGSRTDVGGYTKPMESSTAQFEITDQRDAAQIIQAIRDQGFQPVFKDWELI